MDVIGVIPARLSSTRLEEKLLINILGKPLIQWTWENASKAAVLDDLIIACDSKQVKDIAEGFGAKVIMTSVDHTSGTDRLAEAVSDIDAGVIVNIQGDEPLIHPSVINMVASQISDNSDIVIATAMKKIDDLSQIDDYSVVKVVCDKDGYALYFSRLPIPYYRDDPFKKDYYKHLGIYAYSKDFLYTFKNLPSSSLETAEKLEQLRVLQAGYKIKVIQTQFDTRGVDVREDITAVEEILKKRGLV